MELKTKATFTPETLEEMGEILDSSFDYCNSVYFDDGEEFIEKYGEKLYRKSIQLFEDEWHAMLGEAIEYGFPSFEDCVEEAVEILSQEDK
tara:strand:- start:366 stop:638 length:273 start_codon:yes stop_codon:yes gene_type:complete